MARNPKNANIDIRQTARVFDEQTFVDGEQIKKDGSIWWISKKSVSLPKKTND